MENIEYCWLKLYIISEQAMAIILTCTIFAHKVAVVIFTHKKQKKPPLVKS